MSVGAIFKKVIVSIPLRKMGKKSDKYEKKTDLEKITLTLES